MFARAVVYLHAACPERSAVFASRVLHRGRRAHLPVPKSLAAKSSVSISSKLIEIKGLQLHYFGHLRKTGGRGSHRLVHTAYLPLRKPHGTKSHHSRTYEPLSRKSNYSRTYAIPGGWGVFPDLTFKYHLKCRRADIFDFSPDFSHFSRPEPGAKRRSPRATSSPLSVSARQYCAAIAWDVGKTEAGGIPAGSGSPRCGYVPFANRCPDAHD